MKLLKAKYILSVFFILVFTLTSMQAAGSQITFPDDVDDEGPTAPIDGFIAIGVAAGAYLGYKKHKRHNAS